MTALKTLFAKATRWWLGSQIPASSLQHLEHHSTGTSGIVREKDVVLLRRKGNDRSAPILTKPLRRGDQIQTGAAPILADNIIGKSLRDLVSTSKGFQYRIHEPSLAEYTDLSPRLVTPIYSQDTNLIVSLLDLHPSTPDGNNGGGQDNIEIFEAGTGHGALTLNLARAIHGANTAAPLIPHLSPITPASNETEAMSQDSDTKSCQRAYDVWRSNRRGVIHTLDQSAAYSARAQQTVKNFRQGMYFPNVDFHVGSIEDYLSKRLAGSDEPFLNHAILDLPNTHHYLDIIGKALKSNGSLVTWCPSITQINKCVMLVKKDRQPFLLEKVTEVGSGLTGGRIWDVRMVRPRALTKTKAEGEIPDAGKEVTELDVESEEEVSYQEPVHEDGWEMVCRPKVGVRVIGGGFIALWRKMER